MEKKQNKNVSKKIILLGKSEIAGCMAPANWGTFATIGDAEIFGRTVFKTVSWAVGEEITKKDSFGKVLDVTHELVSPIFNPRHYDED